MSEQPNIESHRLLLRPFVNEDAPIVQELAGDRQVAATTLNIPHPYEDGVAEKWISTHEEIFNSGTDVIFAITRKSDEVLVGAIGLVITSSHRRGEMGYWIGRDHWGNGYCTEAAKTLLHFGFDELDLNKICARHMDTNPASGRVLQKIGMRWEGCLKQHYRRWDVFVDYPIYGILRDEYEHRPQQ